MFSEMFITLKNVRISSSALQNWNTLNPDSLTNKLIVGEPRGSDHSVQLHQV